MEYIQEVIDWFSAKIEVFTQVIELMAKDFLFWVLELFAGFTTSTLDTVFATIDWFRPMDYLTILPPEIHNVLVLIGFGEMVSILLSAIIIKITMNFMPSLGLFK